MLWRTAGDGIAVVVVCRAKVYLVSSHHLATTSFFVDFEKGRPKRATVASLEFALYLHIQVYLFFIDKDMNNVNLTLLFGRADQFSTSSPASNKKGIDARRDERRNEDFDNDAWAVNRVHTSNSTQFSNPIKS